MKVNALKSAVAAALIASTLATTGCASYLERSDKIRAEWEAAGVTRQMDQNWHHFNNTEKYALGNSGTN